jgi:acyl-CoA reductase-like NAD-dependent aldehyde dehydrogenase
MSARKIRILNWIDGAISESLSPGTFEKVDPHNGSVLFEVIDSSPADVDAALRAATDAFRGWSQITPVRRGQFLSELVGVMKKRLDEIAACVATETGKPYRDAVGEVGAAILQGEYFASEGMRLFGRSLTSGVAGKHSHTVRQPLGIAALIVPANTPIANIAWKAFPALICGNTVILKASEDAPKTALLFAELTREAGLPPGVFNVIHGRGKSAGATLVADCRVSLISFTGSTEVGRWIAQEAGRRLARVSLELGGKNPFVVCDDADLEQAAHWACLSAFSNAGQRCAAASRILVFRSVYQKFKEMFVEKARNLRLGIEPDSDLGPIINLRQKKSILQAIDQAKTDGAHILCGGKEPESPSLRAGFYIEPTIIEGLSTSARLACNEIFGPVASLHIVDNLEEALSVANNSDYGLTACIHTRSVDRAMWFVQRVKAGVANVNMGTYGSEPHMPFGGFGDSGNGSREPGVEALDVYSELKNISFLVRSEML